EEPPLQLRASVLSQTYCKGINKAKDTLKIKLLLRYINRSKEALILYKYSYDVVRISVARSLEDITAKRYEMDASQTIIYDGKVLHINELRSGKFFVSLSPGDYFDTETEVYLQVARSLSPIDSALTAGDHFITVIVTTWPYNPDTTPELLRDRWHEHGYLWANSVTSIPALFSVSPDRKVEVSCEL